jgi:hypothetical protein
MIVAGCRLDLIAAAQRILPNQLHWHIRIAWLGEITESGSTNESAFALRIEPAYGFTIGNDWCEWRALLAAIAALSATLLLPLSLSAATTALSASAGRGGSGVGVDESMSRYGSASPEDSAKGVCG